MILVEMSLGWMNNPTGNNLDPNHYVFRTVPVFLILLDYGEGGQPSFFALFICRVLQRGVSARSWSTASSCLGYLFIWCMGPGVGKQVGTKAILVFFDPRKGWRR